MYSLTNRLNTVFFYGAFCLAILCGFNILSTIFLSNEPKINSFKIHEKFTLYNNQYTGVQHSRSYFDLNVDFTESINWNNHITFMWISAEYMTGKKKNQLTKVTIYDMIIPRDEPQLHKVNLKDQIFEYPIVDAFKSLSGKSVTFRLNWEHKPVVGPILKYSKELTSIDIQKTESKPINMIIRSEVHYEDIYSDN